MTERSGINNDVNDHSLNTGITLKKKRKFAMTPWQRSDAGQAAVPNVRKTDYSMKRKQQLTKHQAIKDL
jgi:hypothetical protein